MIKHEVFHEVTNETGLICPDIDEENTIEFQGNGDTADNSKFLIFRVTMCKNKGTRTDCMPEDVIRKYLHGLMIDSWLTMYAIDFDIYNKQPLVQVYEKDKISLISESLEQKNVEDPGHLSSIAHLRNVR